MSRKPRTTRPRTRTATALPAQPVLAVEQPARPQALAVEQPARPQALAVEQPARPQALAVEQQQLAGQLARGAAAGTARAVTDWIIEQITAHFQ
ncbi:hypothetical protein [Kitasatospora sp. NPDC057223]|uniref:hypothetical protein n=1 Tax=Kitasatospora sp. NPDC057223 TaxID=3346055 RepID=UPI00362975E4